MKKLAVILFVIALVLAAVAAAGYAWRDGEDEASAVQIEPAEAGELVVSVSAPGEIEADTQVNISAKTSAQIVALPFEEGQPVVDGDGEPEASVLVRLDDTDARARVRAARAGRAQAAANLAVARARIIAAQARQAVNEALLSEAETDLERQQSLFASSDVSQKAVDEAETAVRRLKAEVETERLSIEADDANLAVLDALIDAAEAEIERAEEELSYTTIRSPIDGIVTKVNAEVGEIVVTGTMNNAGTVVMEVADFSTMICTAEVDEASIASVSVGQRATVRSPAYDDLRLGGVVRSVSLAKTASIGDGAGSDYYEVEVLLDEDGTGDFRKFSGLTADVEVETERYDGVLRVPSQAVLERRVDELPADLRELPAVRANKETTPVVYRVIDGKAVVTPVEIGESDLLNTRVNGGLEPGEPIVVGPFKVLETLKHDQVVKPEGEGDDE